MFYYKLQLILCQKPQNTAANSIELCKFAFHNAVHVDVLPCFEQLKLVGFEELFEGGLLSSVEGCVSVSVRGFAQEIVPGCRCLSIADPDYLGVISSDEKLFLSLMLFEVIILCNNLPTFTIQKK